MHLYTYTTGVEHRGHIGSDDAGDLSLLGCIDDLAHELQVLVIYNGIDREVALDTVFTADGCDLVEVFGGEVIGALGAHIEPLDTEVYRVSARTYGRHERLIAADRRHDFIFVSVHSVCGKVELQR